MLPKTKLQKRVMSLYKKLPSITKEQKSFGISQHYNYFVTAYSTQHYCLECGTKWKERVVKSCVKKTCPNCKQTLKKLNYYNSRYNCLTAYFSIVTTIEDMQVVRSFEVRKYLKKNTKAEHGVREINCLFFTENKKRVSVGRTAMYNYGSYRWSTADMEIRKSVHTENYTPYCIYPKFKVLKKIKMKGLKNSFHKISSTKLIECFLGEESIPETLFKAKQYSLCSDNVEDYRDTKRTQKYWNQIKICMRNNYIVKNASDWFDYIELLARFGKDIHSPKYICPADFHKEHQRYVQKANKIRQAERLKERIKEIKIENKKYLKEKKDFLDFIFKSKGLTIEPFKSVAQFLKEGDLLNHCIYSSSYYDRKNSLVFSVRLNNTPIETLEYCLKTNKVLQCRGKNNVPSKMNDKIINLFTKNKSKIDARIKQVA